MDSGLSILSSDVGPNLVAVTLADSLDLASCERPGAVMSCGNKFELVVATGPGCSVHGPQVPGTPGHRGPWLGPVGPALTSGFRLG